MFFRVMGLICVCGVLSTAHAQRFNDPRIEAALDRIKQTEPTIQEAQSAALRFYNIDAQTVGSMRTRAQLKALLPKIDVRFRAGEDNAAVHHQRTAASPSGDLQGDNLGGHATGQG